MEVCIFYTFCCLRLRIRISHEFSDSDKDCCGLTEKVGGKFIKWVCL